MPFSYINSNLLDICNVYFFGNRRSYFLCFPITAMINICAILLLLSNLLVFGIHQYNQKKARNLQKCN